MQTLRGPELEESEKKGESMKKGGPLPGQAESLAHTHVTYGCQDGPLKWDSSCATGGWYWAWLNRNLT